MRKKEKKGKRQTERCTEEYITQTEKDGVERDRNKMMWHFGERGSVKESK